MNLTLLRQELIRDEGDKPFPYVDFKGNITIGIGRNLTAKGLSAAETRFLFDNDITSLVVALNLSIPWWTSLSDARQRALANMAFNLGPAGLLTFRKMLAAIQARDWKTAHHECLDSKAARDLPARYARLAQMLLTNTYAPL
jgi:lysozyme